MTLVGTPAGRMKGELIEVEIDGQIHFAIGSLDVGREEFRLQIHELLVIGNLLRAHVARMQVGHIAVAIGVARFPDSFPLRVEKRNVHPNLRLRAE